MSSVNDCKFLTDKYLISHPFLTSPFISSDCEKAFFVVVLLCFDYTVLVCVSIHFTLNNSQNTNVSRVTIGVILKHCT